jgi:antitoxin VapB
MPFHIRDPETDALVRELARQRGQGLTETVRAAVEAELKRGGEATPMSERLRALQDKALSRPPTGLAADKAFYDRLSGETG